MKTIAYQNITIAADPIVDEGLKVGDRVTFTNDYGVVFEGHKVIGFVVQDKISSDRTIHIDSDCYWSPVSRSSLKKV